MPADTVKHTPAIVSSMPSYSGDGYGWGGGTLVTFGDITVPLGEARHAHALAVEMAKRWNAFPDIKDALIAAADMIERNGYREWPGGSLAGLRAALAKATGASS